jgi:hypothetical protein
MRLTGDRITSVAHDLEELRRRLINEVVWQAVPHCGCCVRFGLIDSVCTVRSAVAMRPSR